MLTYITPADVTSFGGRLGLQFAAMSPIAQRMRLGDITLVVDAKVGQNTPDGQGALMAQTGVTFTKVMRRTGSIVFLPNKPLTAVTAISIQPRGYGPYSLPIDTPTQTVYLSGGNSFEYIPGDASVDGPIYDALATDLYREKDILTVTYNCGIPYWVSSDLATALNGMITAGAVSAVVDDASNLVEGDVCQIDTEYVTLQAPLSNNSDYGQPAVDYVHNTIWFPYTPTQVSHADDAVVTKGASGMPDDLKLACFKLLQDKYFRDIDNPVGALEIKRGSDMLVFGRGIIANLQEVDVEQMLSPYKIEVYPQ